MNDDEKRQLTDAAQEIVGAERKLIAAMQNFVDARAKAGKSNGRALEILRQLLRKRREEKANRCRAAFKVVE
jgi:hypothetical protein